MKIDFSQCIRSLEGTPLLSDDGKDLLMSTVAVASLLSSHPDDAKVSGEEKYQRYDLARRIYKAAQVDLTVEEVAKIKQLIARQFTPAVIGSAYDLIENKGAPTQLKSVKPSTKTPS